MRRAAANVHYEFLSEESIQRQSACEVVAKDDPRFGTRIMGRYCGGADDPHMGVTAFNNYTCAAPHCMGNHPECSGHFGYIDLGDGFYRSNCIAEIAAVLNVVCHICGELLIPYVTCETLDLPISVKVPQTSSASSSSNSATSIATNGASSVLSQTSLPNLPLYRQSRIISAERRKTHSMVVCPHRCPPNPTIDIKRSKQELMIYVSDENGERSERVLRPAIAKDIFSRISPRVMARLGLPTKFDPTLFIMGRYLPVIPNCSRPPMECGSVQPGTAVNACPPHWHILTRYYHKIASYAFQLRKLGENVHMEWDDELECLDLEIKRTQVQIYHEKLSLKDCEDSATTTSYSEEDRENMQQRLARYVAYSEYLQGKREDLVVQIRARNQSLVYNTQLTQYQRLYSDILQQIHALESAKQDYGSKSNDLVRSGISRVMAEKLGLIRNNMICKRTNCATRAVAAPPPSFASVQHTYLPETFFERLVQLATVEEWNIDRIYELMRSGQLRFITKSKNIVTEDHHSAVQGENEPKKRWVWDEYVNATKFMLRRQQISSDGNNVFGDNGKRELIEVGDVVEYVMQPGTRVFNNRQPSLWRYSTRAFSAYPWEKITTSMHLSTAPSYNGDFDGDELNSDAVPSLDDEVELESCLGLENNIIANTNECVTFGLHYNAPCGLYLLTRTIKSPVIDGVPNRWLQWTRQYRYISELAGEDSHSVHREVAVDGRMLVYATRFLRQKHDIDDFHHRLDRHLPRGSRTVDRNAGALVRESYLGRAFVSMAFPRNMNFISSAADGSSRVVIRDGILVEGLIRKDMVGALSSKGTLIVYITQQYGEDRAVTFVNDLTNLSNLFLESFGYSLHLSDLMLENPNKSANTAPSSSTGSLENNFALAFQSAKAIVSKSPKYQILSALEDAKASVQTYESEIYRLRSLGARSRYHYDCSDGTKKIIQTAPKPVSSRSRDNGVRADIAYMENEVISTLSQIRTKLADIIESSGAIGPDNSVFISYNGSKCTRDKLVQMLGALGQQIYAVGRPQATAGSHSRSSFHFLPESDDPAHRGFVCDSYFNGLDPDDMWFHAQCSREGIISTKLGTAGTGTASRLIVKLAENTFVAPDKSVRRMVPSASATSGGNIMNAWKSMPLVQPIVYGQQMFHSYHNVFANLGG